MSHSDSNFYKPFAFVLGALVIFTLFIMFVANTLSPDSPDDPLVLAEMKKSIAPVGQSRVVESAAQPVSASTTGDAASTAETTAETAADTETSSASDPVKTEAADAAEPESDSSQTQAQQEDSSGQETVASVASDSGNAAGAAAATGTGVATMASSMKVKAVVATNCAGCHNAGLHGAAKSDDADAWASLSAKGIDELTASVINGKGKMPARAESSLSDDELRQAVQLMIANATGESSDATATNAATAGAAATTAAVAATTEPVKVAEASVPAEIPSAVKQVVDSTCAACHIAGVANAPKYGDKAAWDQRMEKGIDAVTASAIAGVGAMPPRGGSPLNDEQMKLAIEYMLTK